MSARAVLPCVFFLIVAAAPAQGPKKELEKLQGEWTMVSLEENGKKFPGEHVKKFKLTIKGEKWMAQFGDRNLGERTFKIDPSKSPKRIDMTVKAEGNDLVSHGIYKVDGDTLTLCRARGKGDRPKEFKCRSNQDNLEVWKRVKK